MANKPYQITFMEEKVEYIGGSFLGERYRTVQVPLSLDLHVDDDPVGDCCAIRAITGFFYDDDFKRHREDHQHVTVEALKEACKDLKQSGKSIAFATINTEQKLSEAALIEAGFICSTDGWCYRDPRWSRTKTGVKVFIKPLHKVLKNSPRK